MLIFSDMKMCHHVPWPGAREWFEAWLSLMEKLAANLTNIYSAKHEVCDKLFALLGTQEDSQMV